MTVGHGDASCVMAWPRHTMTMPMAEVGANWALATMDPADCALCHVEPVVDGECACKQKAWVAMALAQERGGLTPASRGGLTPVAQCWSELVILSKGCDCWAIASHVRKKLTLIAQHIEQREESWADYNWHESAQAKIQGAHKYMRTDPHVKNWVVQQAIQRENKKSIAESARSSNATDSTARAWMKSEMSGVLGTMRLDFTTADSIVGICGDGVRLGNPAKEYLLSHYSDILRNRHGVLPPQVLSLTSQQ